MQGQDRGSKGLCRQTVTAVCVFCVSLWFVYILKIQVLIPADPSLMDDSRMKG